MDNFIGGPKKPEKKRKSVLNRKRQPDDVVFTINVPKAEGNTFNWEFYRYR